MKKFKYLSVVFIALIVITRSFSVMAAVKDIKIRLERTHTRSVVYSIPVADFGSVIHTGWW